jgi:glycerol-3-phosphate dehydrogenase
LRYLQTLDIARARESVLERRTLARIAPDMLAPLPFALPLTRSLMRGSVAMRAGFVIDRMVAHDRNDGVIPELRLPAGRVLSRAEAIDTLPALFDNGLAGAALWHDYVTTEADRLTFSWALAANGHGAALANYVRAVSPITNGNRVIGVRATDRMTGREFDVRAQVVVNATGGAVERLTGATLPRFRMPVLKAMNLVTRRASGTTALGGLSPSGRNLFLVPWRGRAVFGTWESAGPCDPDDRAVTSTEVKAFIDELNRTFPRLDLTMADVALVHRGAVPAAASGDGRVSLQASEQMRDHAQDGIEGLMSVAGTKYTTARAVAERVVDTVLAKLGRQQQCLTAQTPLPSHQAYSKAVADLAVSNGEWRESLGEDCTVTAAHLVWAVRHEMALTLNDAVIRRTPLGALGYPGDAAAERAARIVGAELGWTDARRSAELRELRDFYEIREG